jgi:hypothetical protein
LTGMWSSSSLVTKFTSWPGNRWSLYDISPFIGNMNTHTYRFWIVWGSNPGKGRFSSPVKTCLGTTQPPIQWSAGLLFLGVKWQKRVLDDTHASIADIKERVEL